MSEQTAVGQITLVSVLDGEPGRPGLDGKPGERGKPGQPGQKGATGKGLDKIVTMYYLSTSSETPSGGQWSRERPKWRINTYLWTYQELHWVNPKEVTETDPQLNREWSASREMVRGERNLALDSGKEITSEDSSDWLAFFELSEPLKGNTTYTLVTSVDLKNNDDNAKIYAYHNGGRARLGTPMRDLGRGIYTLSIEMGDKSDVSPQIGLKNEPIKTALSSTVHWFKIVKGEVTSYDWQPAPEDRKAELSQAVVDFDDKMGSLRSEVHSLNSKNEEKIVSMRQDISGIQMRVESKGALYKDLSSKLSSIMNTVQMKSYRLNQPRLSSLDYELSFRLKGVQSAKLEVAYRWRDSNNYIKDEIVHTKRFGIDSNHYHLISFALPGLPGERGVVDFHFTNEQNKDFTIQDITIKENYQRGMLDTVSLLSIEQGKITSQVEGVKSSVSDVEGEYSRLSQTVEGFTSTVVGLDGKYTSVKTTVDGMKTSVIDLEGNFSDVNQTVSGLKTSITSVNDSVYKLEASIDGLTSTVASNKKGLESSISQTDRRISMLVAGTSSEASSFINMLEGRISIEAPAVDLRGYVTFSDLASTRGTTTIHGSNIKTGTLSADRISTGILSASNNASWIDLSTGEFSFMNGALTHESRAYDTRGAIKCHSSFAVTYAGNSKRMMIEANAGGLGFYRDTISNLRVGTIRPIKARVGHYVSIDLEGVNHGFAVRYQTSVEDKFQAKIFIAENINTTFGITTTNSYSVYIIGNVAVTGTLRCIGSVIGNTTL